MDEEKDVLMVYTASWCEFCNKFLTLFEEIAN